MRIFSSESANRLQVILNEIQPRDTNDYFNQAKLMKECDSFDLEDLSTSVSNINCCTEVKGKMHEMDTVISWVSWCLCPGVGRMTTSILVM